MFYKNNHGYCVLCLIIIICYFSVVGIKCILCPFL